MNQANEGQPPSFQEISQNIAKRFLHTVVLVDDKAFNKPKEGEAESFDVTEPGAGLTDTTDANKDGSPAAPSKTAQSESKPDADKNSSTSALSETVQSESKSDPEQLDARSLIALFAKEGLICAVIEPQKSETNEAMLEQAGRAANRADVVVLDWDIHKDNGASTRKIIAKILNKDDKNPDRLRLIIIYTGAPIVESILADVRKSVPAGQHELLDNDTRLVAANGSWRICLVRKPDSTRKHVASSKSEGVPAGELPLEVPVQELPNVICREFARMTEGLVRNVALASLATLRDNTHTLLGHLTKDLDPAFVAHRTLLANPIDAEHHAVELIIGELGSMLHSFDVGTTAAGPDALNAWLRLRPEYQIAARPGKPLSAEEMIQIVIDGKFGQGVSKGQWERDSTTVLAGNDELAQKANHGLAIATSLSRKYTATSNQKKASKLTLGTILKRIEVISDQTEYLLCLQPRCDCVRIDPKKEKDKNGRDFIFVSCARAGDEKQKFHIVIPVRDGDKFMTVPLEIDMSKPVVLRFSPGEADRGVICTRMEDGQELFVATDKTKYEWIGQLKEAQAQRFANDFAMKLSRVGLNEHEWLRRAAMRDK